MEWSVKVALYSVPMVLSGPCIPQYDIEVKGGRCILKDYLAKI